MKPKSLALLVVLVAIVGTIIWISNGKAKNTGANVPVQTVAPRTDIKLETKAEKALKYPLAKEISTPDGFINTSGLPVKIADYIGKKVILLDIWTYSCINCQRTTPYLNAWYEKYEDKGLIIIGLHTPEFDFEKIYNNVAKAVAKFGIKYPVVLDNDYSTWNAYGNSYWPRKYLIDIDGYIVYDHIGEGGYGETEAEIQKLLQERTQVLGTNETIPTGTVNPQTVGPVETQSPETYFGSTRNTYLANGTPNRDGVQNFSLPTSFGLNKLYLSGTWQIFPEYAESASSDTSIVYHYMSKNVYFVSGASATTTISVFQDGKLVNTLDIHDPKLYTLVQNPDMEDHILEIKIKNKGLQAFTFTFG